MSKLLVIVWCVLSAIILLLFAVSEPMAEISPKKNVAYEVKFPMLDKTAPDSFKTGETVSKTCYYRDGGSWTSLTVAGSVTEIATTGIYSLSFAQAEMNHDQILCKFTSTNTANNSVTIRTYAENMDAVAGIKSQTDQFTFTGGKVDANATVSITQEDIDAIASTVVASIGDPKEIKEGNNKKTFYFASSINAVRHVGVGRIDYVKIETKADAASDWTSPTSTKYLYFWYTKTGDANPYKVGENN